MVPMMSVIEMVNCITTSTFLGSEANRPTLKVPFNTFTGWKEDRNKAGYKPAKSPVIILKPILISQHIGSDHGSAIFLSAMPLNEGNATSTRIIASKNEKKDTITDSLKNCVISCVRTEPMDFL